MDEFGTPISGVINNNAKEQPKTEKPIKKITRSSIPLKSEGQTARLDIEDDDVGEFDLRYDSHSFDQ